MISLWSSRIGPAQRETIKVFHPVMRRGRAKPLKKFWLMADSPEAAVTRRRLGVVEQSALWRACCPKGKEARLQLLGIWGALAGSLNLLERRRMQNLNAGLEQTADRERPTIGRNAKSRE